MPDTPPLRVLIKLRREKYNTAPNIYCPLLKEIVYFNNQGFHHATHDGRGHLRKETDARMRLNLLPDINDVIKHSNKLAKPPGVMTKSDPRNNSGKELVFYELWHKFSRNKEVIVVIRKIGNGRLHYYSVRYASKKQNRP